MLKGISPVLSPELLAMLYEMGHGDEIVLADAHFPGHTIGKRVVRADGLTITQLLEGIMPLFELDSYSEYTLFMMDAVPGDTLDSDVEIKYTKVIKNFTENVEIKRVERFGFYDQAKEAFGVVMTGDVAKYGNIILKKGVTPIG